MDYLGRRKKINPKQLYVILKKIKIVCKKIKTTILLLNSNTMIDN